MRFPRTGTNREETESSSFQPSNTMRSGKAKQVDYKYLAGFSVFSALHQGLVRQKPNTEQWTLNLEGYC